MAKCHWDRYTAGGMENRSGRLYSHEKIGKGKTKRKEEKKVNEREQRTAKRLTESRLSSRRERKRTGDWCKMRRKKHTKQKRIVGKVQKSSGPSIKERSLRWSPLGNILFSSPQLESLPHWLSSITYCATKLINLSIAIDIFNNSFISELFKYENVKYINFFILFCLLDFEKCD